VSVTSIALDGNGDPVYDSYQIKPSGVTAATFTGLPGGTYETYVEAANQYGSGGATTTTFTVAGAVTPPSVPTPETTPVPEPTPSPSAPTPSAPAPSTPAPSTPAPTTPVPTTPVPSNPAVVVQPAKPTPLIDGARLPSAAVVADLVKKGTLDSRTFIKPGSPSPGSAPTTLVDRNTTVAVTMRGIPAGAGTLLRIRNTTTGGAWATIGVARADANGMISLPAITLTQAGSYLVQASDAPGERRNFSLLIRINVE
jgi:hypothetical protein